MIKITLTVGIPACGKSTWAKEEVRKDPDGTTRINRDDLRNMMSNYVLSDTNEKLVTEVRDAALRASLRKGRNVILDETNLNSRNFDDVCKVARELGINCMVMEKPFYIELEEAISRDAARAGSGKVGEEIVKKFWKKSGGKQHKFYKPRTEIINPAQQSVAVAKPSFNVGLPSCVVCDLDGTASLFNSIGKHGTVIKHPGVHARSPYDASACADDAPNEPVFAVLEAMYKNGYKIVFCSGREDCYRSQTETFLKKHTDIEFKLLMRKTGDQRKDSIIKEEIYKENIAPKYNVFFIMDDRNQVVEKWRELGLTCFQVAEGNF